MMKNRFNLELTKLLAEHEIAPVLAADALYISDCLEIARLLSDQHLYHDKTSDNVVQIAQMLVKIGEEE
jgi:hypothetical protein